MRIESTASSLTLRDDEGRALYFNIFGPVTHRRLEIAGDNFYRFTGDDAPEALVAIQNWIASLCDEVTLDKRPSTH